MQKITCATIVYHIFAHSTLPVSIYFCILGHPAHSEVMITTCLHNHGMRIGDIGGISEFMPEGYRNRYYIKGVGTNNGTMRWRPPFTMEEIEALGTRDRLFHPVK